MSIFDLEGRCSIQLSYGRTKPINKEKYEESHFSVLTFLYYRKNTKRAAQTEGKANGLWQKTKYANLVRNASSGKYFARFRHNGKLIWRSLETDVLSIAAQRLPDKIKEVKDEQALLASGSNPRLTFAAAAKIYLERVKSSPDYKPKTKAYHEEHLDALWKSWPDVKNKPVKDITKTECVECAAGLVGILARGTGRWPGSSQRGTATSKPDGGPGAGALGSLATTSPTGQTGQRPPHQSVL